MDIDVPLSAPARPCGDIPCGTCERCLRRVMKNVATYALKTEDPAGILRELLGDLGLTQPQKKSGRKTSSAVSGNAKGPQVNTREPVSQIEQLYDRV